MFQSVLSGFWERARIFMPFGRGWKNKEIEGLESAIDFVGSHSAFVAQTTLYGYLRTRSGTRYSSLFYDDLFALSVNIAKWHIFIACIADLAGFTAALSNRDGEARTDAALAIALLRGALRDYDEPQRIVPDWDQAVERAESRLLFSTCDPEDIEAAFRGSEDALVHWAPISDELKILDEEIVRNSIRFKWKGVRKKLAATLRPDALMADFRSSDGAGAADVAGGGG